VCNGIVFIIEKEGNLVICNNRDEPREYFATEINQTQKDKYCMNLLICTNYIGQIKIKRVYTLAAIK
jgi:hypothetical protein